MNFKTTCFHGKPFLGVPTTNKPKLSGNMESDYSSILAFISRKVIFLLQDLIKMSALLRSLYQLHKTFWPCCPCAPIVSPTLLCLLNPKFGHMKFTLMEKKNCELMDLSSS